ncbi:protein of unknown function [Thiomonas sp. Bio17B3]|nr:protein of unknown function [Thiomonas sp. Bio17B3]VDY07674.1 protein of unknown function [Thiomonas sp. Sup16B3]VDY13407.1 conserved protein of unknown function [Thiomonas sp. OC7]
MVRCLPWSHLRSLRHLQGHLLAFMATNGPRGGTATVGEAGIVAQRPVDGRERSRDLTAAAQGEG